MWSWIVGKIIQPFLPYILGGLIAAGLVGSVAAYFKGRADMDAKWQAKNMQAIIDAQAVTIERYRKATEETKAQAEQELRAAQAANDLIAERMKQAQADNDILEEQLAALLSDKDKLAIDKDKLDATLKALRAKCLATPRDVDLDRRLRDQQGGGSGVPSTVVPKPRRSGTP